MLVYRPDGVAEDKEPCDARECIQHCGYTAQPKEDVKQEAPKRGKPAADVPKQAEPAAKPASAYQPTAATASMSASMLPADDASNSNDEI